MTTPLAPPAPSPSPAPPTPGLAIAAVIIGGVAFLHGWVPIGGTILGIVGVVFGILAVRRPVGRVLAIIGIALSALATVSSAISLVFVLAVLPGSGVDGSMPITVAPESSIPPTSVSTPCYSFDGPGGYINNISDDEISG